MKIFQRSTYLSFFKNKGIFVSHETLKSDSDDQNNMQENNFPNEQTNNSTKTADSKYLSIDKFLLNGSDFSDWSPNKAAPFLTETLNKEAYHFFQMAFGYLLSSGVRGDYHEFGCFSGRTMRMALSEARRYELENMAFFAYDSFAGLPQPDAPLVVEGWDKGAMAMSLAEFNEIIQVHGVYVDKVRTIPGFFEQSLNQALQSEMLASNRKIAIVNIDCDLYESAVPVFSFIEPLLQEGSLVYIDDYFCGYGGNPKRGVAGAFHEFENSSSWRFHPFLNAGWWGKSFIAYKD